MSSSHELQRFIGEHISRGDEEDLDNAWSAIEDTEERQLEEISVPQGIPVVADDDHAGPSAKRVQKRCDVSLLDGPQAVPSQESWDKRVQTGEEAGCQGSREEYRFWDGGDGKVMSGEWDSGCDPRFN